MATSGAMAEFARMPPRQKLMVFVAIGGVLALLYWKFVYKSLDEELETAQAQHETKVSKAQKLALDIPKFEELRARINKVRELIEKNQTALPSDAELPAFFETVQHKVAEAGAEIHKWSYGTSEPVESFMRVPVEIELTGTFLQIKKFFASLTQHDAPGDDSEPERIVSIENLSLTNPTVANREVMLNAKFTAVTFRQEDKPVNAKPAPGSAPASGAAKPSAPPPPPASTAPPLPSAATPAGAKARTENAVEKGDARNRNAAGAADGSARLKGGL